MVLDASDLVARLDDDHHDNEQQMDDRGGGTPMRRGSSSRGGGNKSEAAAEKRRIAAELRERNRLERQAAAAQKKAERTRSQVRVQALNLGRKYHRSVASLSAFDDDDYRDNNDNRGRSASSDPPLQLAPIVRDADGVLFLATQGGGQQQQQGGRPSEFENSFQTLQKLVMAPADPPSRPPPPPLPTGPSPAPAAAAVVVDASGGMPVTHRSTFSLPGVPAPPQSPPVPVPQDDVGCTSTRFFAPTAKTYTLPGIAIGAPSSSDPPTTSSAFSPATSIAAAAVPQFGVLRGGTLPTMRQQQQRSGQRREDFALGMSEDQRREQARLERELQDLAVSKQYENLTRLYNTLPELRPRTNNAALGGAGGAGGAGSITHRRFVPQQRRTVRRVFRVGRTPDGDQLSMLTHSTATKASVDDFRLQMQNMSTDKMRRALLAAKILAAGSEAPEALVRRIFHQRQLIVGDLAMAPSSSSSRNKRPLDDASGGHGP